MKPKHKKVLRLILMAAAIVAAGALVLSEVVDLKAAREWMQGLNPALLVTLMAVLPLVGFSVSVVYLVAGAAFGSLPGFAVITGVTAVHLMASHWVANTFVRGPLERFLTARKITVPVIPDGEERSLTWVAVLTPGPPYFVRNYVLALSGIPLRTYFWIAWPVYVLRSCVVIFLGDLGSELTLRRVLVLGGVFLAKAGICAFIVYRMRRRYRHSHAGATRRLAMAGGRK